VYSFVYKWIDGYIDAYINKENPALYAFAKDEAFLKTVSTHLYINIDGYRYINVFTHCMYSFMDG